jgi:hypothetical protein
VLEKEMTEKFIPLNANTVLKRTNLLGTGKEISN